MITTPLTNEAIPISLRKIFEQVAIMRIKSKGGGTQDSDVELIEQLAQVLLAADFTLVYTSCTRILCTWFGIILCYHQL